MDDGISEHDLARYWSKVDKRGPDECWPWMGTIANGYGTMGIRNRPRRAHRIGYEQARGPIPDGLVVDHLCRNRACQNPAHMEPVTNAENILRGESPPARNARKTRCPQGHEYTAKGDSTRYCPPCRYQRRLASGELQGYGRPESRTHCKRGHEFNDANTYLVLRPDGSVKQRACKPCALDRQRARRAAERG